MLSRYIPIKAENKTGILLGALLFLIQMTYFIYQWDITEAGKELLFAGENSNTIMGFHFSYAESFVGLIHIFVHATFSILIIWQLYKDPFNTRFVIVLSIGLIFFYLVMHFIGKYTELLALQMIAVKTRFFLSSPLKTIFSIPALKVRQEDNNTTLEHSK